MLKRLPSFLFSGLLVANGCVYAAENDTAWYTRVQQHLENAWQQADKTDIYIPLLTYHNRSAYSEEKIDSFNEQPWGLGLGTSHQDAQANWQGYYAMAFKDSHNDWEPIGGYAYVKNLLGSTETVNAGLGLTAGFTARSDYHYIPIPIVLPVARVNYDAVSVNATYVPGGKGNGNVLFMWSTIAF